jgi:hypothetical protein
MSWTPATSTGPRAAHPSRIRVLSEHRESTDPSQSHRKDTDPSRRSVHLFSRRSTPLNPFFGTFPHRLGKEDRGDGRAHSRQWKCAYSAQSWCNVSPLDATLLSPLLCVANKGLARYLSTVDATLTKNRGWGQSGTIFHVAVHSTPPPIFRTLFQVPYPVTPLLAALTKTLGVWGYSSHSGTPPLAITPSPEAPFQA